MKAHAQSLPERDEVRDETRERAIDRRIMCKERKAIGSWI